MNRSLLLIVVCLPIFSAPVAAQSSQANKTPSTGTAAANPKPVGNLEAERLVLERRAQAQSLLISLGNDAGTFKDHKLRARTQSTIADALWENDPDRARTLFRKAWEAAEIADAEGQQRMQDEIREQQAKSGRAGYSITPPPELRNEVLRLAVKHDTALGEELLARLQEQKEPEAVAKNNQVGPKEKDVAMTQRLGVAKHLVSAGDTERALQFAGPMMGTVSIESIEFLTTLRDKSPDEADLRYAAMLSLAAASAQSDSSTASVLSSYIFTPHMYNIGGYSGARWYTNAVPAKVAPALRAAFFRAAGEILLRPIPQVEPNQTSDGIINRYNVISSLIPLFAQFAPAQVTVGLRAQLEALLSVVSEGRRQFLKEQQVREGTRAQEPKQDPQQALLDRVDMVKTSAERDKLFFQLALNRAEAGDLSARDNLDRIEESELRHSARAYVDSALAYKAIEKRDAERALEVARTGELSPLLRVWVMSHAARLLPRAARERALQILDDAATEARRMEGSDPDRPRAFLAIANALLAIDRARGWDSMNDVVKAANSAPDFTGEDGQLAFSISSAGSQSSHQHGAGDLNIAEIFKFLGHDNYERAVELAQVIESQAPRANAVIAIALAVLADKR